MYGQRNGQAGLAIVNKKNISHKDKLNIFEKRNMTDC